MPSSRTTTNKTSQATRSTSSPTYNPPKGPPCAASDARTLKSLDDRCTGIGVRICSACHLVGYCSTECQKVHWTAHKEDCKNPLRSQRWKPRYMAEKRFPDFLVKRSDADLPRDWNWDHEKDWGGKQIFWGEHPPIDVINLKNNENDPTRDLNLMFFITHDFRDVLETVVSLPDDYSGKLTITLCESAPNALARHALMLLILSSFPNPEKAIDAAIHFWFSAFLPTEYHSAISGLFTTHATRLTKGDTISIGNTAELRSEIYLKEMLDEFMWEMKLDPVAARKEFQEVHSRPGKVDTKEYRYFNMEPSHRLASKRYRESGVVQPFGASPSLFTEANWSLFDPKTRKWGPMERADPINAYSYVSTQRPH